MSIVNYFYKLYEYLLVHRLLLILGGLYQCLKNVEKKPLFWEIDALVNFAICNCVQEAFLFAKSFSKYICFKYILI